MDHFRDNKAHGHDAFLIKKLDTNSFLIAVFDGLSSGDGKFASNLAAEKLKNAKNYHDIISSLEETNRILSEKENSRTTAAVAFKEKDFLFVINVGDSPAYLIREDKILQLTVQDRISMIMITNALGYKNSLKYHLKKIKLKKGDKLVLVTDGISDNLNEKEILEIVEEESSNKAISKLKLILKSKKNNVGFKVDDMTAIIRYF